MAKKKSFLKKIISSFILLVVVAGGVGGYFVYKYIYQPNVSLGEKKTEFIYIRTGWKFEDVKNMLYEKNYIINRFSFELLAEKKKYKNNIKPGRYRLKNRMANNALINHLRAGLQEPMQITLNNIRTKEQLVSRVCKKLEADSVEMTSYLNDDDFLTKKFGMTSENILSMFIPNTYEFYWNTSSEQFLERMAREYKAFWNDERRKKAKSINLSQSEVSVLASIVQAEQNYFNGEKKIIAGLYLNRIKKEMPLQSDPTLIYAIGDFTIQRVLDKHKEVRSPYNTYTNLGLPPGPINLPEISSLDAVLNYEKNDYIYMCAKEDFSGRHNFSKILEQHNIYAAKYKNVLNKKKILR